jgi:hypothetical protein
MKSIILAAGMTLVLLAAVTLLMRYVPSPHRAQQLLMAYLGTLIALIVAWGATPADLGVLPPSLLTEPAWLDLWAALFYFSAAFFGGVLQLYNLADRGLSLRMVIDMAESHGAIGHAGDLVRGYAAGRGLAWMYRKRLDDMLAHHLITLNAGRAALTGRGRRTASLVVTLRRLLGLETQR